MGSITSFGGKPVVALPNVGCFLRLSLVFQFSNVTLTRLFFLKKSIKTNKTRQTTTTKTKRNNKHNNKTIGFFFRLGIEGWFVADLNRLLFKVIPVLTITLLTLFLQKPSASSEASNSTTTDEDCGNNEVLCLYLEINT